MGQRLPCSHRVLWILGSSPSRSNLVFVVSAKHATLRSKSKSSVVPLCRNNVFASLGITLLITVVLIYRGSLYELHFDGKVITIAVKEKNI
jgi:hypothetical protein